MDTQNKLLIGIRNILKMSKNETFAMYTTDSGSELKIDGEIAIGSKVSMVDQNGTEIPAPDGEHELIGVAIIVVSNGVISEIKPIEEEPPVEIEVETTNEEMAIETEMATETPAPLAVDYAPEIKSLDDRITKLESDIAKFETMISELESKMGGMKSMTEKMSSLVEKFEMVPTEKQTTEHTFSHKRESIDDRFKKLEELKTILSNK